MPFQALELPPGINVEKTPLLNKAGWATSAAIRFRDGLPEKIGGWSAINTTAFEGVCRGLHGWGDLSGEPYVGVGTNELLYAFIGGDLNEITPIRSTDDITVDFSTVSGTAEVTIVDNTHGAAITDWIEINVHVSVGGLVLQGLYQITTVDDANTYRINAAGNADATVNNGGAVPVYDTTNGMPEVDVALADHGLIAGNSFYVHVSTAVGGFTLSGSYEVTAVTDADNFQIEPGGNASSTASVSENSGNARILYLLSSGPVDAFIASGFGSGAFGSGAYGGTAILALTPPRTWFLDNFGEVLVGSYAKSEIYVWTPPFTIGNRAQAINTTNFPSAISPPTSVNQTFVSTPQRMIVALGSVPAAGGSFDPNLVRWCDAENYLDWLASATNLAGSYRIPSGSALVGGISAPNFNVIWTDIDMYLMTYLGGTGAAEFVWGFNKVANTTLLGPKAVAIFRNVVFWCAPNGFYFFNGTSPEPIACPVWDKMWRNLSEDQFQKANAQVNSLFQEVSWAFPSADGDDEVDTRVTLNLKDGSWTYDESPTLTARTAWIDRNVYGTPIGADTAGYLQQHEVGYNSNGDALPASVRSGWFAVAEGTLQNMIERLEHDLIVAGGTETVYITIYAQDHPIGPVRTYGPYPWTPTSGPPYSIVRARGRFMSIEISSTAADVFWRLGNVRLMAKYAGRR